jgi:uncharacterized protein (DUF488 family)
VNEAEVYTLGHSNHPFDGVLELLKGYKIDVLLDIRSRPHMNIYPEFSRRRMKMRLAREGIIYIFMGDLLGPTPKSPELTTCLGAIDYLKVEDSPAFQKGLSWLLEESRNARVCLFCGEADPFVCHRHHLVGQNLLSRGVRVKHIRLTGQVEEAEPDLFHRALQ